MDDENGMFVMCVICGWPIVREGVHTPAGPAHEDCNARRVEADDERGEVTVQPPIPPPDRNPGSRIEGGHVSNKFEAVFALSLMILIIFSLAYGRVSWAEAQKTPTEVELLRKYVISQDNIIAMQDQIIKDQAEQLKAKCP
jgi:hypothetical protein